MEKMSRDPSPRPLLAEAFVTTDTLPCYPEELAVVLVALQCLLLALYSMNIREKILDVVKVA